MLATAFLLKEKLTIGEIAAICILIFAVFVSAKVLCISMLRCSTVKLALDQLFVFFDLEPEQHIISSEPCCALSEFSLAVRNICFRFNGGRQLFQNVSFSVNRGQFIGIFGEAGSGKTTILRILERTIAVESGDILLNSVDWLKMDNCTWRKKIAVVPHRVRLINRTLIENLCFDNVTQEAQRVIEFCRTYHFDSYFESLPQGYLTIVGEDGVNLSASQRQLVGLSRALFVNPILLLLDDVTSLMDKKAESFTLDLLKSLKQRLGIILFTNRLPMPGADCIYLLERGEMRIQGTHDNLMQYQNCYSGSCC
jgi:ATP-binding cassette subfamily B protein